MIWFLGTPTGNVINETSRECNVVDINADGVVDYKDRSKFSGDYELSIGKDAGCIILDFTEDGIIDIRDSSKFTTLYALNSGSKTGPCTPKRLWCESKPKSLVAELASEKIGVWQRIKNFFTK